MTGLPSNIIKKYGVSKKAWAVFRGGKRRKSSKKQYTGGTMAKKRISRKSNGLKGIMGGIVGQVVGVGGYILFESYVEPKLLQMANITDPLIVNIGELAIGAWLSRKSGVVGNIGKAAVYINTYQILNNYLIPKTPSVSYDY